MKKRIHLFLVILLCYFWGHAQNPFMGYGYSVKIATLTQGEFDESHDESQIVEIGSVRFDVKRGKILGKVDEATDNLNGLDTEIVSRFISIDPHCERYYSI